MFALRSCSQSESEVPASIVNFGFGCRLCAGVALVTASATKQHWRHCSQLLVSYCCAILCLKYFEASDLFDLWFRTSEYHIDGRCEDQQYVLKEGFKSGLSING